jgi:hypothetical protein
MRLVWSLRSARAKLLADRKVRGARRVLRPIWTLAKVATKGLVLLSALAACLAIYEGLAPSSWYRPSNAWYPPAPVVSDVYVVLREPITDPERAQRDAITVRVVGERLPPSPFLGGRSLIALVRLANDPGAHWQYGLLRNASQQRAPLARLDAESAATDNWELVAAGLECDAAYRGDVEAMVVSVPASMLQDLDRGRGSGSSGAADVRVLEAGCPRSNARSCSSPGLTPGVGPSPYRQVAQLAANLPLDSFKRIVQAEPALSKRHGELTECSFVTDDYYVYVVVDPSQTVVFYCVTTRNPEFRPRFEYLGEAEEESVQLGVTKFSDVGAESVLDGWLSGATASSRFYSIQYGGNPGNYQDHFLGWNDAGYPGEAPDSVDIDAFNDAMDSGRGSKSPIVSQFMQQAVVNTFGLSAPMFSIEDYILNELEGDFPAGVSRIDVRVLPGPQRLD